MKAQVLGLRFDADSIRCWEEGVPNLLNMASAVGARFTLFVNMGVSFNWKHQLIHWFGRTRQAGEAGGVATTRCAIPTLKKLGLPAALRTMVFNPQLGEKYRNAIAGVASEGHELGLHGGMDHVIWQRHLTTIDDETLLGLLRPAFARFSDRYESPAGFASPGFVFDDRVLKLLDQFGFLYASDMSGGEPFRPVTSDGSRLDHYQVPVTVTGSENVPLIETLLCRGWREDAIVKEVIRQVRMTAWPVIYGHPYVEGVHATILGEALKELKSDYRIVPLREFLASWREVNKDG